MASPDQSGVGAGGRVNQRTRTRAAILTAAADLLRDGKEPTMGEIAEQALVSRRTVYQYYPTLDQLLLDATLGLLTQGDVDEAIDSAATPEDPTSRVTALIEALASQAAETLPLGRAMIRLTVAQPPEKDARRGHRRVEWIERAIEPLRPRLTETGYAKLIDALCMVVGWEALIVLSDVRGLSPQEQTTTSVWAARALIEAALAEHPPADQAPHPSLAQPIAASTKP
jgi:AcrR family transcriptional regulator